MSLWNGPAASRRNSKKSGTDGIHSPRAQPCVRRREFTLGSTRSSLGTEHGVMTLRTADYHGTMLRLHPVIRALSAVALAAPTLLAQKPSRKFELKAESPRFWELFDAAAWLEKV